MLPVSIADFRPLPYAVMFHDLREATYQKGGKHECTIPYYTIHCYSGTELRVFCWQILFLLS